MLRVRTIFASSAEAAANYYTRYLVDAPGEVPGRWAGRQAAGLGLTGVVDGEDLRSLLEGRDPISGTRLGRPLEDRYRSDGTVVRAVAGFDATFSAPKSVSVLWALTGDERYLEAHDVAVGAALAHVERYGSTTRVRSGNGRLHPDSEGLAIAAFRQTTSREDDPQLHTHAVISAKARTGDGRWLALDARYLKRFQRTVGGLYQSVLRNELSHQFGFAWQPIANGQAEIVGVPDELLDVFSKRSDVIEVAVSQKIAEFHRREGRDPNQWELGAIKREAAVDTRDPKSGSGVAELVTRWGREAYELGWTGRAVAEAAFAAGREAAREPVPPIHSSEIVDALSTRGSTWNRAQVMSVLCDVARPLPALSGEQWAAELERACDLIIDQCVELDPTDAAAPRRRSDGRSLWLEPTSPHITTDGILAEEDFVVSWAIDAQLDEPAPSTTVRTDGLDVLQADAAAAVAGVDRLVLVVGPAGAGKTAMLRAAVDDLHGDQRHAFGVAPSAKAARVLERETGVPSDTLAKVLYEWSRPDHRIDQRYLLPAGTTILVDEAGMVGTSSLARLVTLAERQQWRPVLVGDPHQLQAVGRGGMFGELCAQGRSHELAHVHRFTEPWEAAASLLVRQGDPAGLDAYFDHDRVIAGTIDDHLDAIVDRWLDTAARHGTAAIATSTNDHVTAINGAIQQARIDRGQVARRGAPIGGGEVACVGDQVVTRRNDRRIETNQGEPIRNRELWTVNSVGADGSLAVSSLTGHGNALLPVEYVRAHVRLGYAATEHGVQGDTVTIGAEIATPATSRRGLYVALTRGHEENHVYVVTDSHDVDEARDVLEGILSIDRVDMPATAQRRELAQAARPQGRQQRVEPRCAVPGWFNDLRASVLEDLALAQDEADRLDIRREILQAQRDAVARQLDAAKRRLAPHWPVLEASADVVDATSDRLERARRDAAEAGRLLYRSARRALAAASNEHAAAVIHHQRVDAVAAPAQTAVAATTQQLSEIDRSLRAVEIEADVGPSRDLDQLRDLVDALDEWRRWAAGRDLSPDRLDDTVATLEWADGDYEPPCQALAGAVERWVRRLGIELLPPTPQIEPPALDLSIDL